MKKRQFTLCFIMALMVIIGACKKDNGFGSELLPDEDQLDLIYDESSALTVSSKFEDPLRTDRLLYNYLGHIVHPVYGSSTASTTIQYGLPADFNTELFPLSISSVNMYLFYDNYYGDTTDAVTISVHKLSAPINTSVIYKSDYVPAYEATTIGSVSNFHIQPNTPQLLKDNDTIVAKGVIKIPISVSYAQEVIELLGSGKITNDTLFNNRFPGIYVAVESAQQGKTMIQLDLTHISGGMVFNLLDKTGEDQVFVLPFASSSFTHTTLKHDYQGTRVNSAIQSGTSVSDDIFYIQSQGGVKTEVQFDDIAKYKGALINKAILEVYEVEEQPVGFLRSGFVYPLLKGASGENEAVLDYTSAYYGPTRLDTSSVGINGEKLYRYQVNITNLMKNYAQGKNNLSSIYLTNYPFFDLTPRFLLDANAVQSVHVEPSGLMLGGPNYGNSEKRMRLRVWYTLSK